jgi:hypothetical protein
MIARILGAALPTISFLALIGLLIFALLYKGRGE